MSDTGDAACAHLEIYVDEVPSLFVDIGLRDAVDGIGLAITTAADHPPHPRLCHEGTGWAATDGTPGLGQTPVRAVAPLGGDGFRVVGLIADPLSTLIVHHGAIGRPVRRAHRGGV